MYSCLYTVPTINSLSIAAFEKFLLLHFVITLLLENNIKKLRIEFVQEILKDFAGDCEEVYGKEFLNYSTYALLHIEEQ